MRRTTVIGFLGSTLDAAKFGPTRWNKWRPTVSLCMQEDLRIDRLRADPRLGHAGLARYVAADIGGVSPETEVNLRLMDFADPWDFEEVYGKLLDFARAYTVRSRRRGCISSTSRPARTSRRSASSC